MKFTQDFWKQIDNLKSAFETTHAVLIGAGLSAPC